MRQEMEQLIPELTEWNNGDGISVGSWISGVGRYDHFLGYISILWPEFVLYDGCVFRSHPAAGDYQRFMEMLHGDRREVERVMNHKHISDLFTNSEFHLTEKGAAFIGATLKEMWSCKLRQDFPERLFEVEFITEGEPEGAADDPILRFVVTFSQPKGSGE